MSKAKDLEAQLKVAKEENAELRLTIEQLKSQISKERHKRAHSEILLQHYQSIQTRTVADLILKPEPVKIRVAIRGRGLHFLLSPANIIIIESNARLKKIYLKEATSPIEGGPKNKIVILDNDKSSFNELLKKLQGNSSHLFQVNRSIALNIHFYELLEKEKFILNLRNAPKWVESLKEVMTDKTFKLDLYHQKKAEFIEIERYRNQALVPFPKEVS